VGSSGKKRKQSATVKEEKKQAKRKKKQTTGDIKCISCDLQGHSNSRSLECSNHIASKEEVITSTFGEGSAVFTRKLPLTSAVNPAFRQQFQEKVVSCCTDIRRIVFSGQSFVNAYLIHHQEKANKDRFIPDVFCQKFWYSVGQLFPTIEVKHKLTVGYSQCLTEAAKELNASYSNSIVERFEQRLTKFITYKLRTILPVRLYLNTFLVLCCLIYLISLYIHSRISSGMIYKELCNCIVTNLSAMVIHNGQTTSSWRLLKKTELKHFPNNLKSSFEKK
ncbi:hypothetical protein BDF20DRAFT_940718, partial [Mycotypha africana]|uniref:uncharacterized protein n=1 Tax=Mycotypha africana TaxID=64632 RepID=UPI0023017982